MLSLQCGACAERVRSKGTVKETEGEPDGQE